MSLLMEGVSPQLDLSMQRINTSNARTFKDVVIAILNHRAAHPGNLKGETWADRQSASVAIPLRTAIAQQWGHEEAEARTRELIGDMTLVGFLNEEKVVTLLRQKIGAASTHILESEMRLAA